MARVMCAEIIFKKMGMADESTNNAEKARIEAFFPSQYLGIITRRSFEAVL